MPSAVKKNFYIGDYRKDSKKHRGWLVGYFIKQKIRQTNKIEIKYWKFPVGKTRHQPKVQRNSLEISFILKGRIEGEVNGRKIKLKAGQYIVILPGTANNLPISVLEPAQGLAIKTPSAPGDIIRGQ